MHYCASAASNFIKLTASGGWPGGSQQTYMSLCGKYKMLIPLSDLHLIYKKIQSNINMQYTSVLIFVALDVDSVCALRIITRLLCTQSIMFNFEPVSTYTQLEAKIESAKSLDKIKIIWFINCGGRIDLSSKWFLTERSDTQVFLWDVQRPIAHENIEHPQIKIIDDGCSDFTNYPTAEELQQMMEIEQMEEQEDQAFDYDDEEDGGRRRAKKKKMESLKKIKMSIIKKHSDYYGHQYAGMPSSMVAYRLARQTNKSSNNTLWLAILGLTSHFMEGRMDKETYDRLVGDLKVDVRKGNDSSKQVGTILEEVDYRFQLLRHWSLYESISYSPYMVMKMKLWNETGKNKLHEFLTRIGISLEDARQLYKFMSKDSQYKLKTEILTQAQKMELEDVMFDSFARHIDPTFLINSSDICCAVSAILETPEKDKATYDEIQDNRKQNFLTAYKFVESASIGEITERIEQYKNFTKVLITESISAIDKSIIPGPGFVAAIIKNDSKQKQVFEHPYSLIRLAYSISGMHHAKRQPKTIKPFVVSIQSHESETCTVVGIVPDYRNPFSTKFTQIAENNKYECRHDTFQGNIITLKKQDFHNFIAHLTFDD